MKFRRERGRTEGKEGGSKGVSLIILLRLVKITCIKFLSGPAVDVRSRSFVSESPPPPSHPRSLCSCNTFTYPPHLLHPSHLLIRSSSTPTVCVPDLTGSYCTRLPPSTWPSCRSPDKAACPATGEGGAAAGDATDGRRRVLV